jgi:hypothetical protein
MKLSPETTAILKNFATINPSLYFEEGSTISTISPVKNILVDATIQETIPKSFGIYDLNNFLSVTSLFKDGSDLEFDDHHVIIRGGRSKIKYRFTDRDMIVLPPDRRPNMDIVDITFTLTKDDLSWLIKTASVLSSSHLAVESDGSVVSLVTFDESNDASNTNSMEMSEIDPKGISFKLIFKIESLKLIPDTYEIGINHAGISVWKSSTTDITYYITLEKSSKFG